MEVSSSGQFALALLGTLLLVMAIVLRKYNWKEYFSTKTGKGILKGIVIAVCFALFFALVGCSGGTYFNDASVYAGLDYTKNLSPQCEDTGPDSHTTSNLGLRGNIYESQDGRFRSNAKYTHHSCAFSPDDASYDALGLEFEYKFFER